MIDLGSFLLAKSIAFHLNCLMCALEAIIATLIYLFSTLPREEAEVQSLLCW